MTDTTQAAPAPDDATWAAMTTDARLSYARSSTAAAPAAAPAPAPAAPAAVPGATAPAVPPGGSQAESFTIGDTVLSRAEVEAMVADKAARQVGHVAADAYKLEPPSDPKLPVADASNPMVSELRALASGAGLTQVQFSKLLDLNSRAIAAHPLFMNIENAKAAKLAKLGSAGTARIDAVFDWIQGMIGNPRQAASFRHVLLSSDIVQGFETLIKKSILGPPVAAGRQEPTGTVSDAEYAAMSYGAKLNYARAHQGAR